MARWLSGLDFQLKEEIIVSGFVEFFSLARPRIREPNFPHCIQDGDPVAFG
jgi:hypothetical protein